MSSARSKETAARKKTTRSVPLLSPHQPRTHALTHKLILFLQSESDAPCSSSHVPKLSIRSASASWSSSSEAPPDEPAADAEEDDDDDDDDDAVVAAAGATL